MVAVTKSITYEQYLNLPEVMQRYEILDGEMIMSPAPTSEHQWIVLKLAMLLSAFISERSLGVVLIAPVDVIIRREPLRTRQSDVLYLSAERTGVRGRAELRTMPVLEIAPDLIVDVLSPGDTRREYGREAGGLPANRGARGMVGQPGSGDDRGRPIDSGGDRHGQHLWQ